MMGYKKIIGLTLALSLSACGFKPMYAEGPSNTVISQELSSIAIAPIPERLGQQIHNGLMDQLNPYGAPSAPQFMLVVSLDENLQGFGFRHDESITRQNFRLNAHYRLLNADTQAVMTEGEVTSNMAFDVVQSDFANHTAFEDARNRTADQIIATLVLRLGSFFHSQPNPS